MVARREVVEDYRKWQAFVLATGETGSKRVLFEESVDNKFIN